VLVVEYEVVEAHAAHQLCAHGALDCDPAAEALLTGLHHPLELVLHDNHWFK